MNVFWLDEDPRTAARYHCDQHVNKMLLEAAQLCCTALREHGCEADYLYRATHRDHPLARWAGESRANWTRLLEFARALDAEFRERYGHDESHASRRMLDRAAADGLADALPDRQATDPPQCMPERYRRPGDLVGAYRAYYAGEKREMARWDRAPEPDWLADYRGGGGDDGDEEGGGSDRDPTGGD